MEDRSGEVVESGDAGQFRAVQRSGAGRHEPGPELVATIGGDHPALGSVVPADPGDTGREQGVLVEPERGRDPSGVGEDLVRRHVLRRWHGARLLEERQVDHRRRVAHRTRVPVPVPDPADIPGGVDEADIAHPGLDESRRRDETGEPGADDGDGHLVMHRIASDALGVRVVEEMGETAGRLEVLVVAVGADALVALGAISGPQFGPPIVTHLGHRSSGRW